MDHRVAREEFGMQFDVHEGWYPYLPHVGEKPKSALHVWFLDFEHLLSTASLVTPHFEPAVHQCSGLTACPCLPDMSCTESSAARMTISEFSNPL